MKINLSREPDGRIRFPVSIELAEGKKIIYQLEGSSVFEYGPEGERTEIDLISQWPTLVQTLEKHDFLHS